VQCSPLTARRKQKKNNLDGEISCGWLDALFPVVVPMALC
jgi:hypothetical protein